MENFEHQSVYTMLIETSLSLGIVISTNNVSLFRDFYTTRRTHGLKIVSKHS